MNDSIPDSEARYIASLWHSGVGSPLWVFMSTGAIVDLRALKAEIQKNIRVAARGTDYNDLDALDALYHYVRKAGARGKVEGWHKHWPKRDRIIDEYPPLTGRQQEALIAAVKGLTHERR